MIRVALAATLSPLYGIYSGYELCENEAVAGPRGVSGFRKIPVQKARLECAGNIKDWIARLNKIRKENRALQFYTEFAVPRRR